MAMEGRSNQGQTEVYALEGRINRWEGNKRKPRQFWGYTQIAEMKKAGKSIKQGGKPGKERLSSFLIC